MTNYDFNDIKFKFTLTVRNKFLRNSKINSNKVDAFPDNCKISSIN